MGNGSWEQLFSQLQLINIAMCNNSHTDVCPFSTRVHISVNKKNCPPDIVSSLMKHKKMHHHQTTTATQQAPPATNHLQRIHKLYVMNALQILLKKSSQVIKKNKIKVSFVNCFWKQFLRTKVYLEIWNIFNLFLIF